MLAMKKNWMSPGKISRKASTPPLHHNYFMLWRPLWSLLSKAFHRAFAGQVEFWVIPLLARVGGGQIPRFESLLLKWGILVITT